MKEMSPADNLILDFQPVDLEGKSVVLFQRPRPQYLFAARGDLHSGAPGAARALLRQLLWFLR